MIESKKIGLSSAIIVQMNAMIGAGIVAIPAFLAQQVGPAGILSHILSIVTVLCMSISLARLSIAHPAKGWTYQYPSQYGGHILGMISSFSYIFGVLIAMGFLAKQAGVWINEILPIIDPSFLSISVVILLTLLVVAGAQTSSIGQFVISIVVLLSIIIISLICFTHFDSKLLTPFMPNGIKSVFSTAPKILFGYLGFECVISLHSITHNPQKNVMKAGVRGVILVGLLYLIFSSTILSAIAPEQFASEQGTSLALLLSKLFPNHKYLNNLIYLGGLFAILGTIHSMIWTIALLLTDIVKRSKNRSFLKLFELIAKNVNRSTITVALIICLSALLLHDEVILSMTVSLMTLSYILSIATIFFKKDLIKSYRIIYAILAVIGCSIMLGFSINSIFQYFIS